MRTLPDLLDAAVKLDVLTLCRLVEITRQDGTVIRLTDNTTDISVDGDVYRADVGFTTSALLVGFGLNQAQGLTLNLGLVDGVITKQDLRSRKLEAALAVFSECDFTQPDGTKLVMFEGKLGRTVFMDTASAQIELLPLTEDGAAFADEVYSQTCRASLGDSRCKFPIESFAINFVVTGVTSRSVFTVDTFGPTAAGFPDQDYFAQGQMKWLTGANAEWEADILGGAFNALQITTFFAMPEDIQVGDTGKMYPGCDRQLSTCANKFANTLNFRGEPFAPVWSI